MRLLDLFCGAGGAAMGYHRAGFEVVGVDLEPQPNYPFDFVQADVRLFPETFSGWAFDAIHASPPCQLFSRATHFQGSHEDHEDLITPTRELLEQTGLPFVIENVAGAPVRKDVTLCGEMFGLRVHRHRYFEVEGFSCPSPKHRQHVLKGARHNCHIEEGHARQVAGNYSDHEDASDAMGIDWMHRSELREAIPPAYTEYIGRHLLAQLTPYRKVA